MYRASLAAAILGALLMSGPAHAEPSQKSGVILAQWEWGGPPPPYSWGGGGQCRQLRRQLHRLYAMRESSPPWQRAGIQPGIRETRAQLRYYCPGYY